MNKKMKRTLATLAISTAMFSTAAIPAWASEAASVVSTAAASTVSYTLTDSLQVEVKSLFKEHNSDSTKLGAVIRMKNTSGKVTRVPDYELRIRTADGVDYVLKPSTKNPKAIQPKSDQELSYMSTVDGADDVAIASISFVDVDLDVYPKQETNMLTITADADMVWNGSDSNVTKSSALLKWGESFTLPSLHSPIQFVPVDIHKEITTKGVNMVVQIQAVNPTNERQTVPSFGIDGKTDSKVYPGNRAESKVTLEAGEKKYVHIVIPTELDTEFNSLNVVTEENFASASGDEAYRVGRVNILLPAGALAQGVIPAPQYTLGTPVKLDSTNNFVPANVDISLEELHITSNEDDGFQTAVAKFKLTNNSDRPLPIPPIQTELISKDGYAYVGSRQAQTALTVVPKASYVVSYAFALPSSETGEGLRMNLYSKQTNGDTTYKSLLATAKVPVQKDDLTSDELKLYPYDIKINHWSLSGIFLGTLSYNYKLKLDLTITADKQVTADAFNNKLLFELYDRAGSLIGSSIQPISGTGRLYDGTNTIDMNAHSSQLDYPITVKVYEVFTGELGEQQKRLLTTFSQ
ncbi:hypothetical protein [Paenibacillus aestuarii]|uniref:Uncharacterized protein n=1 Tax=Paenibacillus aestuarii TaxID=516965 RepID=A0ABW0K9S9_9BACL|nr:hypothetical protein [Paenibacillus aestuarii]